VLNQKSIAWISGAILAIIIAQSVLQSGKRASEPRGNDFGAYMIASKAIWSGESPYRVAYPAGPYIYPPFVAVLMYPLTALPQGLASGLWALFSGGLLLLCLRGLQAPGTPLWKLALFVLLYLSVVQQNLVHGQINILILAGLLYTEHLLRNRRTVLPGLIASLAIAPKITPGLVLLYSLLRRRLTFLAAVALALPVLLLLVPWLFGLSPYMLYSDMAAHLRIRADPNIIDEKSEFSIQDIAMLSGLIGTNLLILQGVILIALAAFLSWLQRAGARGAAPNGSASKGDDSKAEGYMIYALFVAAIVLVSPLSERHHLAFIMPLSWLLFLQLGRDNRRAPWAVAYFIHLVLLVVFGKVFGDGFYLAAVLALIASATLFLRSTPPQQPSADQNVT